MMRYIISRREILRTAIAAPAAILLGRRPGFAEASQPRTAINFEIPAGACDCHVHVFGDPQRFPFSPARVYTPEPASVEELRALHTALRIDRLIVVQPSVYGSDNACVIDAVRQFGNRARGVVVLDDAMTNATLDEMARAGVRGVRVNLTQAGITDPAAARKQIEVAGEIARVRNWPIQVSMPPVLIEAITDTLSASPTPLVFDHFGGVTAASGVEQPGFAALINLVKKGNTYVKLSAAGDGMSNDPAFSNVAPFAKALVAANPQRMLWGTNWPHPDAAQVPGRRNTDIAPLKQTDDGRILNLLPAWVPDGATRRMILVENPARLYGL
jgi:predicted TIM-barrel fold metal-dependent hydrolase